MSTRVGWLATIGAKLSTDTKSSRPFSLHINNILYVCEFSH